MVLVEVDRGVPVARTRSEWRLPLGGSGWAANVESTAGPVRSSTTAVDCDNIGPTVLKSAGYDPETTTEPKVARTVARRAARLESDDADPAAPSRTGTMSEPQVVQTLEGHDARIRSDDPDLAAPSRAGTMSEPQVARTVVKRAARLESVDPDLAALL